ncbi:MAG: hypothetical protein ACLFNQ_02630 [Spirochaetaceae bacterium]
MPSTLFVVCMIASCGLTTGVRVISPPERRSSTINSVVFEHALPQNDDVGFQGYELYYKIYGNNQSEAQEADENAIEGTSDPFSVLNERGFRRFQLEDIDRERPPVIAHVIPPVDEPVTFSLDFLRATGPSPESNPVLLIERGDADPVEYRLVRTIQAAPGDFGSEASRRAFNEPGEPRWLVDGSDDAAPHADVDSDYDGISQVSILIYAIGQALDVNTLTPIRSLDALQLIEIEL